MCCEVKDVILTPSEVQHHYEDDHKISRFLKLSSNEGFAQIEKKMHINLKLMFVEHYLALI